MFFFFFFFFFFSTRSGTYTLQGLDSYSPEVKTNTPHVRERYVSLETKAPHVRERCFSLGTNTLYGWGHSPGMGLWEGNDTHMRWGLIFLKMGTDTLQWWGLILLQLHSSEERTDIL